MLRNRRTTDREIARDLADRPGTIAKLLKDRAAGWIGKC